MLRIGNLFYLIARSEGKLLQILIFSCVGVLKEADIAKFDVISQQFSRGGGEQTKRLPFCNNICDSLLVSVRLCCVVLCCVVLYFVVLYCFTLCCAPLG